MTRRFAAATVVLLGCQELPEVSEVGAHVEVAADPERTMCGGTLAHMDELVARASAEFSLAPPSGEERFRLYFLVDDEFFRRSGCPGYGYACARGPWSFTRSLPVNHELVHNVATAFGRSRPFFAEGLATVYEGLGERISGSALYGAGYGEIQPELAIREFLTAPSSRELIVGGAYELAGAFVAFLIRRHGAGAFARAYEAIDYRASAARIDAVFREAFGESLDDSIAAFDATARGCTRAEYDVKLVECAAPELAWTGDVLVHHRTLACEQADAVGPYVGDSVLVFNTLEIAEAGGYELLALGEPAIATEDLGGFVSLMPCAPCSGAERLRAAGDDPETYWLEAGRYSVRLRGSSQTPTSIGLRLTRVPGFPRPDEDEDE